MPESGRSRNLIVVVVLVLLVPAVLGGGWLLGRLEGPPPRAAVGYASPYRGAAPGQASAARFTPRPGDGGAAPPAAGGGDTGSGVFSNWTTYADAVQQSRANGKPVLVDFNAEWCGPCQALKRTVFDDPARGRAIQMAVIPVSIVDRRREDGSNPPDIESLQGRYQVEAFPTVVVFSPATGRTAAHRGFGDPDEMMRWVEEAARSVK